jgi:hypothetical protein
VSRFAFLLVIVALLASSCARPETLGPSEAVEVMVLDGVDRGRAVCVVDALYGQLDLAKVTGLAVDLNDDELALLASSAAACSPAQGAAGFVVGADTNPDEVDAEVAAENTARDIENHVNALIAGGLEVAVGNCLMATLGTLADPQDLFDDTFVMSTMTLDCRESVAADRIGG